MKHRTPLRRSTTARRTASPREDTDRAAIVQRAEEFNGRLPTPFRNIRYLVVALTHSSFASEHRGYVSNEKLEFVGDGIVNFVIAELVFLEFPEAHEGDLSKMRAALVKEQGIYERALELGLDKYLLLGKGEERMRDERKPAILADGFEALVAALYFDRGMQAAASLIRSVFRKAVEALHSVGVLDHKTALQEETQRVVHVLPSYETHVQHGGGEGATVFTSFVYIGNVLYGEGLGPSKKKAEEEAAKAGLEAFLAEHPRKAESSP